MVTNTSKTVKDIVNIFKEKYENKDFVIDNNGTKTIEILGASFIADSDTIIGTPNIDYIRRELDWYKSESLNVYDIEGNTPKIWAMVSDVNGNINSNYGWAIFSEENGYQYKNVIRKLKQDPFSRQAIMIYNRPSMHSDYISNGKRDFMCCQNVHYFIRDNKLETIVNFRSNDARFGYINDLAWVKYVNSLILKDLAHLSVTEGNILWNAGSLHIYERDFGLLEKL